MTRWPAVATDASVPVTRTKVGCEAVVSLGTVITVAVPAANARALTRSVGMNASVGFPARAGCSTETDSSGAASTATVTPTGLDTPVRTASLCRPRAGAAA